MATVVTWMRSMMCGLGGHDNLLQFSRGRMYLKCVSCGHESPGWDIKQGSAGGGHADDRQQRRRVLPQLAGLRRPA